MRASGRCHLCRHLWTLPQAQLGSSSPDAPVVGARFSLTPAKACGHPRQDYRTFKAGQGHVVLGTSAFQPCPHSLAHSLADSTERATLWFLFSGGENLFQKDLCGKTHGKLLNGSLRSRGPGRVCGGGDGVLPDILLALP